MLRAIKVKVSLVAAAVVATTFGAVPSASAIPPSNDEFATATAVASVPFQNTSQTIEATSSLMDPTPSCGNGSTTSSVWFRFAPAEFTELDVDTVNSDYDTILTAYRQGSDGGLEEVACNDEWEGSTSRVFLGAEASQVYYFMISSASGPGGVLVFTLKEADTLELEVGLDELGWAEEENGSLTITGTAGCTRPERVAIEVSAQQRRDGKVSSGYDYKTFDCRQTFKFQMLLRGSRAGFADGKAGVDVTVYTPRRDEDSSVSNSRTVVVRSCTIVGTLDSEELRGTKRNDKICGLDGNDRIYGGAGDDEVRGFDGHDVVFGGAGNDLVTGGHGDDKLEGGGGNDILFGDFGHDKLNGGPGKDSCTGGTGNNRMTACE